MNNKNEKIIFEALEQVNERPEPFEYYTASDLWTDEYTSEQMLSYHLNPDVDLSSRNFAFIERSADWIKSEFKLGPGKKVADFGCGPGLYTTRLARSGANITGIDFSKRSIQYAQETAAREGLNISYVNENYLDFETEDRFDLIIMIMCDFCALSPQQRKTMLEKFLNLLAPGGSILLDLNSIYSFAKREEAVTYEINQLNNFWSPDKYYGFQNTFKYEEDKLILDKYTIIEKDRLRTVYNWMQHFSVESIKKEIEESGLTLAKTYCNVAGDDFAPEGDEFAVLITTSSK